MTPSREKALSGITFFMAYAAFSLCWMVLMGEKSVGYVLGGNGLHLGLPGRAAAGFRLYGGAWRGLAGHYRGRRRWIVDGAPKVEFTP